MKLFVIILAIYLGIDAVVCFIKAFLEPNDFPTSAVLDIIMSISLMIWAIVLLAR